MQKIADVLDVNVSELLGADIIKEDTATQNEIATQLARISSEQHEEMSTGLEVIDE